MIKGVIYGIIGAFIYDKLKTQRLYTYSCPDPNCQYKHWTNNQSDLDKGVLAHIEEEHH